MNKKWRHRGALVLCLYAFASLAMAQGAPKGNADAGQVKFNTCTGCHGVVGYQNAYPDYNVPKLGGQHADYIIAALKDYRSGARQNPIMRAQAKSLSEQDIQDIAAFIARQNGK